MPDQTALLKVTLNLFQTDVDKLKAYYGFGWSERVREVVREHVKSLRPNRLTIGDLLDDRD